MTLRHDSLLVRLLSLAVALGVHEGGCAAPPLVAPRPIAAAATPTESRTAILRALLRDDWTVESDRPGTITARREGSGWNMVVAIRFADQITVSYVSSDGLDYEDVQGDPRIHGGYTQRTQRLTNDIGREIVLMRATNELPAVAAPARPSVEPASPVH